MTIGFVGLGKMGGGLARNLLRNNHELLVYDVRPAVVDQFVGWGAHKADSLSTLAASSSVIFTSLPMPTDVIHVVLDEIGPHLAPDSAVIDVSTIDPASARLVSDGLRKSGHHFLACPLGKGPAQAEEGTEPIFAGGDPEVYAQWKPLLEQIGDPVHYLGDVEQSTAFKLISNHIGMTNMAVLAEGLAIGARAKISLDVLVRLLADTGAQSHQLKLRGPWVIDGDYAPRFAIDLTTKDIRLAVAMAETLGARAPLGQLSLDMFKEAQARGWGQEDTGAIYKLFEESGDDR